MAAWCFEKTEAWPGSPEQLAGSTLPVCITDCVLRGVGWSSCPREVAEPSVVRPKVGRMEGPARGPGRTRHWWPL